MFTRVPVVGHALLQRQLYVAEVIASHLQLVPQVQLVHTSTTWAYTSKVKICSVLKLSWWTHVPLCLRSTANYKCFGERSVGGASFSLQLTRVAGQARVGSLVPLWLSVIHDCSKQHGLLSLTEKSDRLVRAGNEWTYNLISEGQTRVLKFLRNVWVIDLVSRPNRDILCTLVRNSSQKNDKQGFSLSLIAYFHSFTFVFGLHSERTPPHSKQLISNSR